MKKIALIILGVITAIIVIPLLSVIIMDGFYYSITEIGDTVTVYIAKEDKTVVMNTRDYLQGVVAAEMPGDFNIEALKAQAVAARTYLLSHINACKDNETPKEHKGAVICTDSKHCQAWISENDRKQTWEEDKKDEYWHKIQLAVDETAGKVMIYDNKPISAVFHSTSSGNTESAEDVWGSKVPYLISVKSDGEELSPRYISQSVVSIDDFKKLASENIEGINTDSEPYSNIIKSNAGGIKTIDIYGVNIKGTKLREIFGLRSTNVEIVNDGQNITFNVKGNGHGVGMSQYGANYLAGKGMGYEEILKHYYSGIEILGDVK